MRGQCNQTPSVCKLLTHWECKSFSPLLFWHFTLLNKVVLITSTAADPLETEKKKSLLAYEEYSYKTVFPDSWFGDLYFMNKYEQLLLVPTFPFHRWFSWSDVLQQQPARVFLFSKRLHRIHLCFHALSSSVSLHVPHFLGVHLTIDFQEERGSEEA